MPDRLKVKHIRTSQFGKDPSASTIDYGEIAINYNSGSTALYIRDNADNIVKFAPITVDSELDSGSTNPVANSAVTTIIYEDEEIISSALNDLNDRKADKEYVDEAVSSITIDIDSELDTGSTNPVANSAITQHLVDTEYVISQALNDLEDRKADKSYVDEAVSSITIAVDDHMDSASTNPVQNKVVKEYIDEAVSSITIDVDSEVDSASTNPVENRAIYEYISDIEEVVSSSLNDLNDRKADKSYVDAAVSSITIDVDSELDTGSTNPIANSVVATVIMEDEKVISAAFNDLNDRILEITPNDGVLTIQKNGTTFGTFSANSESAVTVNMLVNEVPASTASDSGKVLMVNASGQPEWTLPSNIYSGNVTPSPQLGNNGDIYIQTS